MNSRPYSGLGLACFLSALAVQAHAHDARFSIYKSEDMNFGSMVVIVSGTVILEPSQTGNRTGTAQVMIPTSSRSNPSLAKFTVTCTAAGKSWLEEVLGGLGDVLLGGYSRKLSYRLALDTPTKAVHGSDGEMTLSDFKTRSSSTSQELWKEREVSNCNGYSETIYVGATLSVGLSQPPGHYTSSNDILLEVRDTSSE